MIDGGSENPPVLVVKDGFCLQVNLDFEAGRSTDVAICFTLKHCNIKCNTLYDVHVLCCTFFLTH